MSMMDVARAIEIRTGRQREQQQAVSRPARVRFSIFSEGTGQQRLVGNNGLSFNAWLLEEPSFTFGIIALDPVDEGGLPQATATVLGWRMLDASENQSRGPVWLGADMGFRVESEQTDIRMRFSLTFEGHAMRSFIETN